MGRKLVACAGHLHTELRLRLLKSLACYHEQADDRTFYKAAGLLRRAEGAANGAERASLAAQALQLMGRVPAAVDLAVVVPQLALLQAWDGVVSLPLQVQ